MYKNTKNESKETWVEDLKDSLEDHRFCTEIQRYKRGLPNSYSGKYTVLSSNFSRRIKTKK